MKNLFYKLKKARGQKASEQRQGFAGSLLCHVQQKILNIFKKLYQILINILNDELLPGVISFFIWLIIDVFRYVFKIKDIKPHVYGIYGYFGLWGQGKTIGMTRELYYLRKRYKDKIYIFTNYGFKLEDKVFDDWKMLLDDYDKPAVFAWDEVQNEFNSRAYKNFPTELLTILTQNRKNNGKRVLYTAQRWHRVDKVFRELTYMCYECKTRFGRLTSLKGYHWEDYEDLTSSTDLKHRMKVKSNNIKLFVQTDYLRSLYDSYQMLQTAKTKEYLDRSELIKLN